MTSAPATAPAADEAAPPSPPASPQLGYQPALDGIRALAVLAVMLFHAGFGWAVGGYLGVDAFFVLSGFLITNLLLAEWQRSKARPRSRGSIDLSRFYARRIRRLFPALVLMMVGVGLYAAFIAPSTELNTIRGDALATLGYVGNWRQMLAPHGYFAQIREPSPLQHTWSLAVEEQWYLVWPLVLCGLLALRLRIRTLLVVVVSGAIASMLLMLALYHGGDVSRVYYGTDTRAQELLIGTSLAVMFTMHGFARTRAARRALHWAAGLTLAVLGWAWVTVDGGREWLYRGGIGFLAMGVALVIASAIQPGPNPLRAALSWKPLCWVGMISYGLYLWHWPVYVWLSVDRTGIDNPTELLALRWVVTFGIAAASYYLVEMPIRHQTWRMPRLSIMVPVATALLVGMVFAVTAAATTDPFNSLERAVAQSKRPPSDPGATKTGATPVGSGPTASVASLPIPVTGRKPRVYITGDSVAVSFGIGLSNVAGPDVVWNEGVLGCGLAGGDLTVPTGPGASGAACTDDHAHAIEHAGDWHADVAVLLTDVWDTYDRQGPFGPLRFGTPDWDRWYLGQLQWLVDGFKARGVPVALLNSPCIDASEFTLHDRGEPWASFDPARVPHLNQLYAEFAQRNPKTVTLFDLDGFVCPGGNPVGAVAGENIRTDGVHFSTTGAEWASRWLLPQLVTVAPG